MKDQQDRGASSELSAEDKMSGLFAQLVLQQANMATMLLGKMPHPETGQVYKDIEAARLFIDELEMLENKTKGNLTKEESGLLKQSLMSLRLAFVEAVESPESQAKPSQEKSTANVVEPSAPNPSTPASAASEDEHRKKFSKKY